MARKARKTEHHGPKRGSGSYWRRKKDAKRDSSKKRPSWIAPKWFTYTLFKDGVRWEVRGLVRRFSYAEVGLADWRCKSRKSPSKQPERKNRLYLFIGAIAGSPGDLLRWPGKSRKNPKQKPESEFENAEAFRQGMNCVQGQSRDKLPGPAMRRDFCKRLKRMFGVKSDPFFNYRRVGGYQPRFKLVDMRSEPFPDEVMAPEQNTEALALGRTSLNQISASREDDPSTP